MTISEMNQGVPDRIAQIIEEKGLKKKVVADRAGISAQNFADIMNGRRLLKVRDIVAFAKVLNVTPAELLPGAQQAPDAFTQG